jgi:molecular chaperone GrpE (heat shock protein)/DNA-binding Xre family transcriptional regulator
MAAATARLRQLMAAADIPSFRALARQAEVSNWSVEQLRRDRIAAMRVDILQKLATALQLSLPELLSQFGALEALPPTKGPSLTHADERVATLEAEYQRLQAQLEQQADQLQRQFQREALRVLESWLVQWPTVTHAVAQNPDLPASRLVPLVQPVQALLEQWGVEAIAPVGAEIPFDPQQQQLMNGTAEPGDRVRVRYTGFRQGDILLHRAKVSPVD